MLETKQYNPDSLIFDMDGTLWDAVETYALSWNIYFEKHGVNLSLTKKDLDDYMGLEQNEYLKAILPQFTTLQREKMYAEVIKIQYDLIDRIGGKIYPGVIDGLKRLSKKYTLFIVSNCPAHTIQHFIQWAKISDYITDSIAHGENSKPKYKNIRLLVDKYALKRPLYIGDTNSDSIQSNKAMVPFAFMEYGFGNALAYNLRFNSFQKFVEFYA